MRLAALPRAALTLLLGVSLVLCLGLLIAPVTASAQDGKYVIKRLPGRVKATTTPDASGQTTAKKHIGTPKYSDFRMTRDAASGQASGKRSYKPFTITKKLDKSTPLLMKPAGVPQGGLLDGNAVGGATTGSPAATGSPINRGGAPAGGRLY
jgi:hypothetical protein